MIGVGFLSTSQSFLHFQMMALGKILRKSVENMSKTSQRPENPRITNIFLNNRIRKQKQTNYKKHSTE